MKKRTILFVLFLGIVLSGLLEKAPVQAADPKKATVTAASLVVRDNASPHAKVLGKLKKYSVVFVYGSAPGGWSEIRFKEKKAYVPSSQLAMARAAKAELVVAFGDSNTQGTNWKANRYPEKDKWVTKLQSRFSVINAGVGGDTSTMGKARFQKSVLNKKPDVVLIMFGTNDAIINARGQARVSKKEFEKNIRYFTDTLKARGVRVVLMTTPPVVQGHYYNRYEQKLYNRYSGARQWHDSYNAIVRKVAREKKVTLLDNYKLMTAPLISVSDQHLIKSGWIDPSGTHLTPKGADVIYQSVSRLLGR